MLVISFGLEAFVCSRATLFLLSRPHKLSSSVEVVTRRRFRNMASREGRLRASLDDISTVLSEGVKRCDCNAAGLACARLVLRPMVRVDALLIDRGRGWLEIGEVWGELDENLTCLRIGLRFMGFLADTLATGLGRGSAIGGSCTVEGSGSDEYNFLSCSISSKSENTSLMNNSRASSDAGKRIAESSFSDGAGEAWLLPSTDNTMGHPGESSCLCRIGLKILWSSRMSSFELLTTTSNSARASSHFGSSSSSSGSSYELGSPSTTEYELAVTGSVELFSILSVFEFVSASCSSSSISIG